MTTIRTRTLEFLRPGPPHNQLLSPLVPYVAICGNNPASTVHLRWEHRDWLHRLRALRYDAHQPSTQASLDETARELGHLLGQVEGLSGAISANTATTNHLRLILSPAELASLPFELSEALGGGGLPLLIDPNRNVVLTREARFEGAPEREWPDRKMRVLFAWSDAGGEVPHLAHLRVMLDATDPWDDGTKPSKVLTVLPRATLAEISTELAREAYTHIHILAHGASKGDAWTGEYTLVLDGHREADAVDGRRLAAALCSAGNEGSAKAPFVATLATCDAAGDRSVVVPAASIAQRLHEAGVPLVIASQLPLTFRGSVVMANSLYPRLMAGEHPVEALRHTRSALFSLTSGDHDWASMLAYARLPDRMATEQGPRLMKRLFERMKAASKRADEGGDPDQNLQSLKHVAGMLQHRADVRGANELSAKDRCEGLGLVGSAWKRAAAIECRREAANEVRKNLMKAHAAYSNAADADPTDHWAATQSLFTHFLLFGKPGPNQRIVRARAAATLDQSVEAWGLGSLVELDLLEDNGGAVERLQELKTKLRGQPEPWESAERQLRSYQLWWSVPELLGAKELAKRAEQLQPLLT